LAIATLFASTAAQAGWSANVGFASDYFYRGIFQAPSSASAGLDFESNGFYACTWAADVADGLEIDGYFGYANEFGGVNVGIGFTGYYYTGDFDDTYQEINLTSGYGIATLDVAVGEYEYFGGETLDYAWYALTLAKNGFYGRIASFNRDFDGEYIEVGYDFSLAEVDLGIKAIVSNEDLTGDNEEALVFTIGKSFDF
jgi:hypothetical protein